MATSAAARMRRMRERRRAQATASPILFETSDWRLFIDPRTLPQKAGCGPNQIGRVILKELTDNGLDGGASDVWLQGDTRHCLIGDNGPGIDPEALPILFSVNRPLLSSKLKRLPTRGMLGNGLRVVMGAVAAYGGTISVTTRGRRYDLVPDRVTGHTTVATITEVPEVSDTVVTLFFPRALFSADDYKFAQKAIDIADDGVAYSGYSEPSWYSAEDLLTLIKSAPDATPQAVIDEVFGIADSGYQPTLAWAQEFIDKTGYPVTGNDLGHLGEDAFGGYYKRVVGITVINGAIIPFCVEAWVTARTMARSENYYTHGNPLINRTATLGEVRAQANSQGLRIDGCGLNLILPGPKRAEYYIDLSVITPSIRLMNDGKTPFLGDFKDAIEKVLKAAAGEAYRNLVRPETEISLVDAAYQVMEAAYLKASDNNTLPAKARQIMYAARPPILDLTGQSKFGDGYFTQKLMPSNIQDYPEECADWDVVYDARGHLTEPHTGRTVPLGTLEVRRYLGERPPIQRPALADGILHPTRGARHRYRNILFVEKEGFDELFAAVQLAERNDLGVMSTKGMSVIAARKLLDELAPFVDHIFALHDFDVSGFSIFGTLGTDSWRYEFTNDVSAKIIDIGLRLEDIEAMDLQSEVVEVNIKQRRKRGLTLQRHGASADDIEFLVPEDEHEPCRRVELNAMTSRQLVDFVEAALQRYGVEKVVPDDAMLEQQARHRLRIKLTKERLADIEDEIAEQAATAALPHRLAQRVRLLLQNHPELSWDQAVAQIIGC